MFCNCIASHSMSCHCPVCVRLEYGDLPLTFFVLNNYVTVRNTDFIAELFILWVGTNHDRNRRQLMVIRSHNDVRHDIPISNVEHAITFRKILGC